MLKKLKLGNIYYNKLSKGFYIPLYYNGSFYTAIDALNNTKVLTIKISKYSDFGSSFVKPDMKKYEKLLKLKLSELLKNALIEEYSKTI